MMNAKIMSLLQRRKEGMNYQKIASELGLLPKERELLKKRLAELQCRGLVVRLNKKYFLRPRSKFPIGKVVSVHRGFCFVSPEGEFLEDIFVPARFSGGALLGDVVEILYKEKGKKGKPEGRVVRILEKGKNSILGVYKIRGGQPYLLPFDSPSEVEIPLNCGKKFAPQLGMIVEADRGSLCLKKIIGRPDDPGVDINIIIQRYDLNPSFSERALAEAGEISSEIALRDRERRVDYRSWLSVTIDGEKAQDFDDAVSVKKLENGHYLLGVHISDVSHYVKPGSFLDKEALMRGTSVYFPDFTLPMLPNKLSNNVCSLRPEEERLTFTVLLEVDEKGDIRRVDFHPSLIRTAARMTYDSVFKILEGCKEERENYSVLVPSFLLMRDLARLLKKKRMSEGSLDFDLAEPELLYNEGKLYSVVPFERNEAHQIIEEFMVAANEAVSSFLSRKGVPLIFRVHPPPSVKDLAYLLDVLKHFGIFLPQPKKVKLKDLQKVQKLAEGMPEEKYINLQILKSLKLAHYSDENEGHYGLAKKVYTHFTSPIRRYPDLVVHRILKSVIKGEKVNVSSLSSVAAQCSSKERRSDEAEKDLLEWRIFRFLRASLGEEFEGIIVDISRAGLIVELENYFVEGVVPFDDLGGDYYFRKREKVLLNKRTGIIFERGNKVRVCLAAVDPFQRKMTLALTSSQGKDL